MDIFVERMRKAMKEKAIRQIDVCKLTGVDKSQICNYLKGRYRPNGETLTRIAKALGVAEAWLVGTDSNPVPMKQEPQNKPVEQKKGPKVFAVIIYRHKGETVHMMQRWDEALYKIASLTEEGATILKVERWEIGG